MAVIDLSHDRATFGKTPSRNLLRQSHLLTGFGPGNMPLMTRLILMAAVVAAILAVLNLAWGPSGQVPVQSGPRTTRLVSASRKKPALRKKEDTMPATFHTVAYILLIVLMFGVATGWLGAA